MRCARANSPQLLLTLQAIVASGVLLLSLVCVNGAEAKPAAVREYEWAKAAHLADSRNPEAAWKLGRAAFALRYADVSKDLRAQAAEEAMDACRTLLDAGTNSAALHYYLGLNLGALAETRGLSALKLVNQMEEQLLKAIALDPGFNYAGAHRTLGMLYRDAPPLISVGNRSKARKHLSKAVELAPKYPDNRLELIMALLNWNQREAARRELKALQQSWPAARSELSDPSWADDWKAWEAQLQILAKKLEEPLRLESPRH